LLDVPFFPDKTDQCGPSALASVLSFWGRAVDPAVLANEVINDKLNGSLSMNLLMAAQDRGFKAYLYNGSLEDLKFELSKGHPVVAFVSGGVEFTPIGHYVVVCGFDDARRGLYIHSGSSKNEFVRYKSFERDWEKMRRLTLLILPPGHASESPHVHEAP
jgi:ABC-type bacteriocin/lantibiotic exporter with double-glycine peptidase domain